ncbi:protein piccolo isoform X4 [Esox lucius]|uniref:protein piccolo isoform X4 n=1 Tax=Esox lucius TaxID=8010 RepID=UPI0014768C7E|nr:protein piccolo isoform X4 [Esox lucius]
MFSNFLSGTNPLSSVSSAVRGGLFGDSAEGEKQKAGPQQSGNQAQAPPKQGGLQLQGNGQAGQPSKPSGQQEPVKGGAQQQGPVKGGAQQQGPVKGGPQQQGPVKGGPQQQGPVKGGPQQQGPVKGGPQQQGPVKGGPQQQGPVKGGPQQQGPVKGGPQQQGPVKGGPQQQGPVKGGPQQQEPVKGGAQQQGPVKGGPQQGSPKVGAQQQGSPKVEAQQQGSPKVGAQQQGSPKVGAQQQGSPKVGVQQQGSPKIGAQQQSNNAGLKQQTYKGPQQQSTAIHQQQVSPRTTPQPKAVGQPQSKAGPMAEVLCPVCNTREPPNHNTCTQCKTVVCSSCGFSPPDSGGTEWLCLTCQMQRALGGSYTPGHPKMKPQPSPNKTSTPPAPQKEYTPTPGSPQRKPATSAAERPKPDVANTTDPQKLSSPKPAQKAPQENQRTSGSQKPQEQPGQPGRKQSNAISFPQQQPPKGGSSPAKAVPPPQPQPPKPESGGLFGFGGSKSQPAPSKPEESVSGKMFGFGSSIFSSASTLISSAVQDEHRTTPSASPKMSAAAQASPKIPPAKETKPPAAQKPEEKADPPQHTKVPPSVQAKVPTKGAASSQPVPKTDKSTCPLCKVELNMGSKDPPNYNTCTECKNTVCNLCGFNPMPHETEVKEWLCLNCQMKRMEPPGPPVIEPQPSPNKGSLPQKASVTTIAPQKKDTPTPGSPQRKPATSAAERPKPDVANTTDPQKLSSPKPAQKAPQENQRTSGSQKPQEQPGQPGRKQSNAISFPQQQPPKGGSSPAKAVPPPQPQPPKPESGGLFGFGGSKSQPAPSKPEESVSGKMFGFGSSIFSSASTLISSAVQDEHRTTPSASPKMSAAAQASPKIPPAKETKPPAAQKEEEKKAEKPQQTKVPPPGQAKVEKIPPEPPKGAAPVPKSDQSTCPLCKVELKMGSKDPPNYNTCTECKNTVCNLCGFNPMPNATEVMEWLCLNCQMQRALGVIEPPGLPMMKPQAPPNKVSAPAAPQKIGTQSHSSPHKVATDPASPRKEPVSLAPKSVPSKPEESVSGKMIGFGSSIFNSASTVITSAVQDVPRVTPPVSPKVSAPVAPQKKDTPSPAGVRKGASTPVSPKIESQTPAASVKEDLPMPGFFQRKPDSSALTSKEDHKPVGPLKPGEPSGSKQGSIAQPQQTPSQEKTPQVQPQQTLAETKKAGPKTQQQPPKVGISPGSAQKVAQENRRSSEPHEKPQQLNQPGRRLSSNIPSTQPLKQESGGFLGFGAPKSQPAPSKTEESVSGKMFGFGSSIFSSASTLISSAVQDEHRATPSASPKMSAADEASPKIPPTKETKPPAAQKPEEKAEPPQHTKVLPSVQAKFPGEPPNGAASTQPVPKSDQSTCPLCKVELNMDSKDPPNYNTCTECKNTVCNLCGFNPMPHETEQVEWLCLNCQMQRALGGGPSMMKLSPNKVSASEMVTPTPSAAKKDIATLAASAKKDSPTPGSPQSKPVTPFEISKAEAAKAADTEVQASPAPAKTAPTENQRTSESQKLQQQPSPGRRQSSAFPATNQPPKHESGGLFGFGIPKSQSTTSKPEESVSGKMFGFGSSIFSSASTLITSTVQDEAFHTTPTPPKVSSPVIPKQKEATILDGAQKVVTIPASPKKDPETQASMKETPTTGTSREHGASPAVTSQQYQKPVGKTTPQQKTLQQHGEPPQPPVHAPKAELAKPQQQLRKGGTSPVKPVPPPQVQPPKQSGGFFGFGGPKSQPATSKPDESVSGKMFGFGSSIFSSASTLISSAVQDEHRTTPPSSPKVSAAAQSSPKIPPAKETKPPAAHTAEKKAEQPQQTNVPPTVQDKVDKLSSEPPKDSASSQPVSKTEKSSCPLCKVELNMGSKDPPNYNTCTECKNTVCNLCGFNPMPHETEVTEWLCLNCQMQRALGRMEPLGNSAMKLSPNKTSAPQPFVVTPAASVKKDCPTPGYSQSKAAPSAAEISKAGPANELDSQKLANPAPPQKTTLENRRTSEPQKPQQPSSPGHMLSSTNPAKQQTPKLESGGLFGFGGPKSQPAPSKPDGSVPGKMLGFGSAIFSSASTVITSAVQDEHRTTPPASPNMTRAAQASPKIPPAKETKHPAEAEKKAEQYHQSTFSPLQDKVEKIPSEHPNGAASSQPVPKTDKSNCPLCKVELNMGSKDPPNYNTCTECKNTVCNLCGFNPMPNVTELKEWLCLNCQMHRSHGVMELSGPPMMKYKDPLNKDATHYTHQKHTPTAATTKKDTLTLQKEETTVRAAPQMDSQLPASSKMLSQSQHDFTPPDLSKTGEFRMPDLLVHNVSATPHTKEEPTPASPLINEAPPSPFVKEDPTPASTVTNTEPSLMSTLTKEQPTPASPLIQGSQTSASPLIKEASTTGFTLPKTPVLPLTKEAVASAPTSSQKQNEPILAGTPHRKEASTSDSTEDREAVQSEEGLQQKKGAPSLAALETKEGKPLVPTQSKQSPILESAKTKETTTVITPLENISLDKQKPDVFQKSVEQTDTCTTKQKEAVQQFQDPEKLSTKALPQVQPLKSPNHDPNISPPKQESEKPTSPAIATKAPQNRRTSEPQNPPQQPNQPGRRQSSAIPATKQPIKQESGGLFGFGGPKSQSTPSKPEESVSGKMFGFSSSIFSSATTFMTSAAQDKPCTTPPTSPKVSAANKDSPKIPSAKEIKPPALQKAEKHVEQQKAKVLRPVEAKEDTQPSEPEKAASSSQPAPKSNQSTCPLCKMEFNIGSKELPNYNTCTECKNTVCNLCGFNPMPNVTEVKEWLCLNCQMQRALGGVEPPDPSMIKPQPSKVSTQACHENEAPTSALPIKEPGYEPSSKKPAESVSGKMLGIGSSIFSSASTVITSAVQEKPQTTPPASPKVSSPVAPQQKEIPKPDSFPKVTPKMASPKKEPVTAASVKENTAVPGLPQREVSSAVASQQDQKPVDEPTPKPAQPPPQQKTLQQGKPLQSPAVAPNVKPADSQQQLPKGGTSPAKTAPSPLTQPPKHESGGFFGFGGPKSQPASSKPEESVSGKMFGFGTSIFSSASTLITSAVQDQPRTTPPASPKVSASVSPPHKKTPTPAGFQQTAPTTASPKKEAMTPETVKENPAPSLNKDVTPAVASHQNQKPMDKPTSNLVQSPLLQKIPQQQGKLEQPSAGSPKSEPDLSNAKAANAAGPETQASPVSDQKAPLENRRTSEPLKPLQEIKPVRRLSSAIPATKQPIKQESGGLFGFGGPKSQSTPSKPEESVSGKMFGFGSSIFSSASTLISSAVQDEHRTTPPSSPKVSTAAQASPKIPLAKETKPPAAHKEEKKAEQPQQTKPPRSVQVKMEKVPSEPPKGAASSQAVPKAGQSTCPLCKVELNMDLKETPNYNTCTECKNTVCNLCGFNPMTNETETEWLCLNCQTQRALSGQLAEMEMAQPEPIQTLPKTLLAMTSTKLKPQLPTAATITTQTLPKAQPPSQTVPLTSEPTLYTPNDLVPNVEVPKVSISKKEAAKIELSVSDFPTTELPKSVPPKTEQPVTEAAAVTAPFASVQVTEGMTAHASLSTTVVTAIAITPATVKENSEAKVQSAKLSKSAEGKVEKDIQGKVEKEAEDKFEKETEKMVEKAKEKKVDQAAEEIERLTPQPAPTAANVMEVVTPLVEKMDYVLSDPQKTLPEVTVKEKVEDQTSASLLVDQVVVDIPSIPVSPFEGDTKTGDHSPQDGPDILPISQGSYASEEELKEVKTLRDVLVMDTTPETAMPAKEEVNGEKRRLSYIPMEESSGSEPSPSPQLQRRRLSAIAVSTAASSSSEDYKADSPTDSPSDSPESFVDEEEFIRRQIIGMTGEEEMSLSEEEEEIKEKETKEAEVDYASAKAMPLLKKDSMDNEDNTGRIPSLPGSEPKTTRESAELTEHTTVYKKAMPMTRQRTKSTDGDAEVESITDSLDRSKGEGSSSVQVSSFTPGTSPTSASSLEEDSDSSPTHKRSSEGKQHRKAKHRQSGQPISTIEDSSEEEEFREEDDHIREKEKQLDQQQVKRSSKKSKRDKDELRVQRRLDHSPISPSNLSPIEDASPTEEAKPAQEFHRTSGSDYSPSMESDSDAFHTEARIAVPKKIKFSTAKPLKSAEEAYEEMLQKARSPKKETVPVPEIEPLYDGMAIEDYLYESLVEEPEAEHSSTQLEQPQKDPAKEPGKIGLRSPEEVYEEMIQKKELMLIEQEFKKAMDIGNPQIHVTAPSSAAAECCKVGEAEGEKPMLDADSTYVKRKKRPAPPRPSEPPKRPDVDIAKPKVLQDMVLRRALYPIPDLKITQCSSGEDETDESIIEEYGVGVSSDITPSDESETKEVEYLPGSKHIPITEAADIEPITMVSEVLLVKATPIPASAPETVLAPSMTTTPSSVSPVSPPTSPATPVSPASNATSSSSFQAKSPLSSDSTPITTPTPDLAKAEAPFGSQSIAISPPSIAPIMVVSPTTVLVTVPDLVTDPNQAPTPATTTTDATSEAQATAPAPVVVQISDPVVIQMPDLVTSPSQISVQGPPSVQVTAPTPIPSPVASQLPSPVPVVPSAVPTPAPVPAPITAPAPVVVQMPDLVTTTSVVSHQAQAPGPATVLNSVPVRAAAPSPTPTVVPASGTRRIQRQASTKKKPPPPPPRSTSVSLPQTSAEPTSIRAIQHVSPTMTTTTGMGIGLNGQPIQSLVVDIQPHVEQVCPEGGPIPQVMMTPTRQEHVVIVVPNVENVSVLGQTTRDQVANSVAMTTTSAGVEGISQMITGPVVASVAPFPIAPPLPAVLSSDKCRPAVDTPPPTTHPPPPATLPKPAVYPKKPSVSILPSVPIATVTTTGHSPVHKSSAPPPVPPKPVSIPAGLVFSHRPGESVKPPVVPTASHTLPRAREVLPNDSVSQPFTATTLPRTREPPNALSLSLTTPVESKMSATSPRSPMSPRYAKCLETYVVITLPSEPSTPTEGITVQAPIRRGSIPSTKQTGPEVRTTPSEQPSPIEAFSAQATIRTASVPSLRQPPPTAAIVPVEAPTAPEAVAVKATGRPPSIPSDMQPPHGVAEVVTVSAGSETPIQVHSVPAPVKKPYIPPTAQLGQTVSEVMTEPQVSVEMSIPQASGRRTSIPAVPQQPQYVAEVIALPSVQDILTEVVSVDDLGKRTSIPLQMQQPQTLTEVSGMYSDAIPSTMHQSSSLIEVVSTTAVSRRASIPSEMHQPQTMTEISTMPIQLELPDEAVVSQVHLESTPSTMHQSPSLIEVFSTDIMSRRTSIPLEMKQPQTMAEVSAMSLQQEIPNEALFSQVHLEAVPSSVHQSPSLTLRESTPSEMQQPQTMAEVFTIPSQQEIPTDAVTGQVRVESTPSGMHQSQSLIEVVSTDAMSRTASIPLDIQQPQTIQEISAMSLQPERPSIPSSSQQQQALTEVITLPLEYVMPIEAITTEAFTTKRTSISSVGQPYTIAYPYETPIQVVTTEAISTTRQASITMQQPQSMAQVITMPAEIEGPLETFHTEVPYRRESITSLVHPQQAVSEVLTYSSEYGTPLEIITTEAYARRMSVPSVQQTPQAITVAPVTITRKFHQESVESQEICGPEKVVSSLSHVYSTSISTSAQPPESLPSLVTQVVTTEVQRTTVSVVHERLPQVAASNAVAITIQPDLAKVQPSLKQNGKTFSGDAIDLRTIKVGVKMTDSGMDLTPQESSRQSIFSDSRGRHTAVQPEIVNLSADITPSTTLSVVTGSITIVTCSATISSYTNEPAEKPLDLQGYVSSMPLPLTTYKPFEPLAQIVYRRIDSPPVVKTVAVVDTETPINLSYGATAVDSRLSVAMTPAITNGGIMPSEPAGAVDLSTSRPLRAMVALSSTSPGVVTNVVQDDGTPIDLTSGRSVCCDVIYKLPFTGSCRTKPPVITQPDNRFGYRDDHYQYDHAEVYSMKGMNGKAMSETNLADADLFLYDGKTGYDCSGASDSAIDLTAGNMSAGEALDYTSKAAGVYTGISTAPYSQVPTYSVLRSSDGMVYSSIPAPVPSTYAITTQPGSIFSTTLPPTGTHQEQLAPAPHPYGFTLPTDPGQQIISMDTKNLLPSALANIMTGFPDLYSDQTLEAIAASLDALALSPMFPGLEDSKITQYQMEREFLQLEKLKQLCLAEELEWERQEIQRYREQEQIMVQRELEELQALKQQLLMQQEEEHRAHLVAQQETYNQQREQLEQIQQLQVQLQRQLQEHYGTTGSSDNLLEAQYAGVGDNGQYWPVRDESNTSSSVTQLEGGVQYMTSRGQRDGGGQDQLALGRTLPPGLKQPGDQGYGTGVVGKRIVDSGVQTDDEDSLDRANVGRRRRNNRRGIDSCIQTDDEEDQEDEWDAPARSRRRARSNKHSSDGKHSGSKVSSIAIQTVAEISVQTDHSGSIKRPGIQMDTKVEIIKHISAPENSQRGGSLSCQTDTDRRRHSPVKADLAPKSPKVLYSPVSPLSPSKAMEGGQKMLTADLSRFSSGSRMLKPGQKSLSDPKSLSPTTEDRMSYHYTDIYSGRGSPSGTGKKVKRTLPKSPPEDDPLTGPSGFSTNSARRRLGRNTTMARAKILQDIDKELDLVERESSKLRRKQAELDEEEKEIDAKLRYLEMGINRRKDALLQEREKRERAYLQGVAEERDYMSDSEVSNIRETRGGSHGLERPRTAPQSEFDQFIPPQTETDSQYSTLTSPYSHYAQYVPQTQATSHYPEQTLYQQQALYQQHPYQSQSVYSSVSSLSYPEGSLSHQQAQSSGYQSKNTTNYEVIRNQPMIIVPSSCDGGYGVGKYGSLELRMGLDERSLAYSPMSSISTESFYADIDHHNARNYVLIEDIEQLTKGSTGLGSAALGSGFSLPDKDLSKADRLLRAAEARRTAEVAEFLGNSRLHSYGKGDENSMEEPYELKLLKQQIKQEFRRGTEGLEHLSGLAMPQYIPTDPSYRHFPKADKYSISRLTLEKQAAKQLPAAVLYQKQIKNQKKAALMDPKITKFSPIQESRDLEPDYSSFLGSGPSSATNLSNRARQLQDEITFGLRKSLSEQQKYLGSSLGANLAGSLGHNLGQSLGLGGPILRSTLQDDATYPSGTRSRPSSRPNSRPTSVYGLDLSIKRDLSSSSLRLKSDGEALDAAFSSGVARTKPTSLPISQSRGRIPIVAQNSEEESPLSPVGEPMGMARASAGPLPPISADSRDQFGSSHSLPEVQQHMREESRATRGHSGVFDRDIAFIMDDLGGAMSDSEALTDSMLTLNRDDPRIFHESIRHAYHLRSEDTDWFDKPAERQHGETRQPQDRRQTKLIRYTFPHTRIKLQRDPKDTSVSGNGLGIRLVGGKEIPGSRGEIGAYIAKVTPGGVAEQTAKVVEGMQVLEWNGVPLMGKTYEEVQCIIGQSCSEAELCVRLDLNMLSDPEHPLALENHAQLKPGDRQRSPGVDPKQLAAELQKVSQQQAPGMGVGGHGGVGVLSALDRSALLHSGNASASSSAVPSPGQPASPAINKKQRHSAKSAADVQVLKPHPITGEIQLQINYDRNLGNLIVHVLQARNLAQREPNGYSDPFVKVYLLPGRGQVMVVQNASAENKRRTKYVQRSVNPEWNQTVIYKNIHLEQLKKKTLEVTVWDYDRSSSNDFLGEVLIDLSNTSQLDNTPRWLPLKEQSESIEHSRSHLSTQGPGGLGGSGSGAGQGPTSGPGSGQGMGPGMGQGHGQGPGQGPGQMEECHESPKNSVIKSQSHGIFPDPAKDMQMVTLEKSHSSPGSSKSSSDGQLRSHGPSRSQSKSSVTQTHLEDAGIAIAAAEAAVQQSRLQPRPGHRLGDLSGQVVSSAPNLVEGYGCLDGEEGAGTGVDSAIFQVPRIGKAIPNGTDKSGGLSISLSDNEGGGGKTQVMGEIKVALKKEVKQEGDQLVLEVLQCRNITYKFKSPDHLPDLYVKLYVVNVATQKRIIKKKTRVCRHDREPSFNETFRFTLNPTGHSLQLFLVSNGGKFMKKTLIGEAYIWLDKVDMRKRVVSWHKLLVSSTHNLS